MTLFYRQSACVMHADCFSLFIPQVVDDFELE
jgi:hypothetical protein